jgi:hypothetical protein
MPKVNCVNKTRRNKWLLAMALLALTIVGLVISSSLLVKAQARTEPMALYKDPKGRFSILYPTNWTATPQDKYQTPLVKFENNAGASADIILLSPRTIDPGTLARAIVNSGGPFGYTLFQGVECVKYKMDGQKACSFVFTTQGNPNLGTPGLVVMQVVGQMYSISLSVPQSLFNQTLPTFQTMLSSLKISGSSGSGSTKLYCNKNGYNGAGQSRQTP